MTHEQLQQPPQQNQLTITPNSKMDMLARDIATMTANSLYSPEEIYSAYDLTTDLYNTLAATPEFQARINYHTSMIGKDNNALIRAQARLMSGSLLRDTFEMARDSKAKQSDRLKAIAAIVELADVKPKQEQQFSGMVLNVSFGSGMPNVSIAPTTQQPSSNTNPNDKGVIEHE